MQASEEGPIIRVLIADDHDVVREGTRQILERDTQLVVVAEAANGQQAVQLATESCPDVAVIDIEMPVLDGVEATRGIKEHCPRTAILVLTNYDDDALVFAILEAGAAGYLLKTARGREIVAAVRSVYAGESVLAPQVARKVVSRVAGRPPDALPVRSNVLGRGIEELTPRELEVLRAAARGLSNKDIAEYLVVSPRTVQAHLSNIFGKLQVGSRTEAILLGLRGGWLSLD